MNQFVDMDKFNAAKVYFADVDVPYPSLIEAISEAPFVAQIMLKEFAP